MQSEEYDMHIRAGRYYGKITTCGNKINYKSEESAVKAANKMSGEYSREMEGYPCAWCGGWHIGRALSETERKLFSDPASEYQFPMETVEINQTDRIFGAQMGVKPLHVHNRNMCAGEYCSIHKPSDHPLRNHPLNWRADRGIMERICDHGVGHPDPDDAHYRRIVKGDSNTSHGCDGCCA